MLGILGNRQQALLRLLLKKKSGLTIDELSKQLEITRNAVRQHLASLENDGLVTQGATRPSGGRPEQIYLLTDAGKEVFPRQYSWFALLVVESLKEESGSEALGKRLGTMGEKIAQQLRAQNPGLKTSEQKVERLSAIMEQLGYDSVIADPGGLAIEAVNCVFHNLAVKNPEICQFDLALMSAFSDSTVEHETCMAEGGNVCRFKFQPKVP